MQNFDLKVGMLILMESDLESAVEFYKKLGLSLKFHLKNQWAEFHLGQVRFGLCPTSAQPFERHTGIVLEVNDLNAFVSELNNLDIQLFKEKVDAPHGIMASIKDPSGNIIDLYQPTPEKIKEMARKATQEKE